MNTKEISPARSYEILAIATLFVSAAAHASLIHEHLEELPVLGVLFIFATAAGVLLGIAGIIRISHWKTATVALYIALIVGYVFTRLVGIDDWDTMGLGDKGFEIFGLISLYMARRLSATPAIRTAALTSAGE